MKREDGTYIVYILNSKAPVDAVNQLILLQPGERFVRGEILDSFIHRQAIAKVHNDLSSYMGSINGLYEHPRFDEMYEQLIKDVMERYNLSYVNPNIDWVFARWNGVLPMIDDM